MNRGWLMPLDPLYRAAIAGKNLAYRRGWFAQERLRAPVVSVGNLSVGGAGKTPLIMRLAELLTARKLSVDVLSRGYGRTSRETGQVDPLGNAERFGDEPLLIARRTGVPVFVGASRYTAGQLAESAPGSSSKDSVHLLDDGFQHRRLARDVDIVLLHDTDLSSRLLPSGRMREPLSALRRADFLVVREGDEEMQRRLRAMSFKAPIWRMRRVLALPAGGRRTLAFCGIARPEEFFASLLEAGLELADRVVFSDHHRYGATNVDRLAALARERRAEAFITTEKDAVKLDDSLMQRLRAAAPVEVARLEVTFLDEAAVVDQLLEQLNIRWRG